MVATETPGDETKRTALERALLDRGYRVEVVRTVPGLRAAMATANNVGALIYVSRTVCQAGRGSIRLTKGAHSLLDWELITSGLPVFFVSFGTPYAGWELPDLPNFACAYFTTTVMEETYARLLLGELAFQGRLPVRFPAG